MGRTSDGGTAQGGQPSPSSRPKIHKSDRRNHHRKKKRKFTITDTETQNETLAVTLTANSTLISTSDTHIYTRMDSSTYEYQMRKETQVRRRRKRPSGIEKVRKWSYSTRDLSGCEDRILVLSYNILGVENITKHMDLYGNVLPKYLDWEYRKRRLRKEIRIYKPDILCFQEVDRFDDLHVLLQKDGFRGVYQARTGEACDGCAIFWKDELITLLHEEGIEFQKFGLRDNVAQLCVFKMNKELSTLDTNAEASQGVSSRRFLVGNIHVLFNPGRGDIKLGQMRILLNKAQELSQEWGNIPVVIGGDLNSMPKSPMYQFLASSELDIRLHDRRQISGHDFSSHYPGFRLPRRNPSSFYGYPKPSVFRWSDEELRLATGTGVSYLQHHLKLFSAYVGVPASSRTRDSIGEPLATSYHSKFMGTVDYIWHTGDLVPMRVLETVPVDILRTTGGLPNKKWGSDHLAVACELAFFV